MVIACTKPILQGLEGQDERHSHAQPDCVAPGGDFCLLFGNFYSLVQCPVSDHSLLPYAYRFFTGPAVQPRKTGAGVSPRSAALASERGVSRHSFCHLDLFAALYQCCQFSTVGKYPPGDGVFDKPAYFTGGGGTAGVSVCACNGSRQFSSLLGRSWTWK